MDTALEASEVGKAAIMYGALDWFADNRLEEVADAFQGHYRKRSQATRERHDIF
ncbi:hypothetical protein [Pseudoxanthomonas putridarboris]|uniref:Uncharacterized protein n=1 Tax=Pseudoxanthomonas putridarboris TaxID=752605 RepID=A0ABU9J3E8_9GAMM